MKYAADLDAVRAAARRLDGVAHPRHVGANPAGA
jgi:hypothetical protein